MDSSEQFSERETIWRILDGETSLYEIIVKRFNPYLYKIGRSYHFNHQDTQDLMEETFVDAYKNLSRSEEHPNFKTWIIRIMLNNCYRKMDRSSVKNEIVQKVNDNSKSMFGNPDYDTDKNIQNRAPGHNPEDAPGDIPYDCKMGLSLREINGLNIPGAANLSGTNEANITVHLNRANAMLRGGTDKPYSPANLFEFNLNYCDAMVENVMKKINKI